VRSCEKITGGRQTARVRLVIRAQIPKRRQIAELVFGEIDEPLHLPEYAVESNPVLVRKPADIRFKRADPIPRESVRVAE
jgi:hypothetical protein